MDISLFKSICLRHCKRSICNGAPVPSWLVEALWVWPALTRTEIKKRTDSQRWWKTMKGIERKCSKICKTNTAALATCCPTMSCVRCPCASSCSFSFSSCWSLRSNSFRTCWLQNLGQREVKQNPLGLWISARFMANLGYPNPTSKGRKYQGYQVTTDSPRFAFRTRCEASKDRSSKAQRILPRLIRPWVQFGVCRLLLGDLHILMNHDELKNEL